MVFASYLSVFASPVAWVGRGSQCWLLWWLEAAFWDTKIAETPVGSPLPAPPIINEVAEPRFCHPPDVKGRTFYPTLVGVDRALAPLEC